MDQDQIQAADMRVGDLEAIRISGEERRRVMGKDIERIEVEIGSFEWALAKMRIGEKVAGSNWYLGSYLEIKNNKICMVLPIGESEIIIPDTSLLLETYWEVVE